MNRRHAAVAAGIAVLVLAGCDSDRRAISRDDLPEVPDEPDHIVVLGDDGFDTAELDVEVDDLVEFRITGQDEHGVRADDRIDTGRLLPGESTFVVFDAVDTYEVVDVADDSHTMTVRSAETSR